jgi:putative membrane protein
MRTATRSLIIFGLGTLALAGCGRREAPPPRPVPTRPPAVEVRPLSSANYVATSSSIDLFVIQASQMATSRARSPRVRDIAAMLVRDHQGVSAQMSFAGRRVNLLPPASMMPRHRAMLDQIHNASDFDASYKGLMIAVHEEGFRVHNAYAARGDSPTLRPVAEMAAPAMRRHLEELKGLR